MGLPVLGIIAQLDQFDHDAAIVALGANRTRVSIFETLQARGEQIVNAVHPAAVEDNIHLIRHTRMTPLYAGEWTVEGGGWKGEGGDGKGKVEGRRWKGKNGKGKDIHFPFSTLHLPLSSKGQALIGQQLIQLSIIQTQTAGHCP
jgi:hypothetical protein